MNFDLIDLFNRSLKFDLKDFLATFYGIDVFAFCACLSTFFLHTFYDFGKVVIARFAEFVLLHLNIIINN